MSKLCPPRELPTLPSFDESMEQWRAAQERHFPRWQRICVALALVLGVALLVASMLATRQALGTWLLVQVDATYMAGSVLVYLVLFYLPWVWVHTPAKPTQDNSPLP